MWRNVVHYVERSILKYRYTPSMCWLQHISLPRTNRAVYSASQCCLFPSFTAARRRALDRQCKTFKPPRVSEEQEEDAKPKQLNQVRVLVKVPGVVCCITRERLFSLDGVYDIALTLYWLYFPRVLVFPIVSNCHPGLGVPSLRLLIASLVLAEMVRYQYCLRTPFKVHRSLLSRFVPFATRRRAFTLAVSCRSRCSRGSRRKRLDATRRPRRRRWMTMNNGVGTRMKTF